jgi:hypothetical protein
MSDATNDSMTDSASRLHRAYDVAFAVVLGVVLIATWWLS